MKQFVIANWKLYVSAHKCLDFLDELLLWEETHPWNSSLELIIAPPVLALSDLAGRMKSARRSHIKLAAQDIGIADEGAFTGSVSPRDVARLGVQYAIVGHSERRQYYAEDTLLCKKKIAAAHAVGLGVIYCVGETKHERHEGRAQEIVREQIRGVEAEIIAYEPRWAIGTGIPIEPSEAQSMHAFIMHELRGASAVCYGGSVSVENVSAFMRLDVTRGVLIGSASTKLKSLCAILSRVEKIL